MDVESLVAGQDFSSNFFARVRAKHAEKIKHIFDRKKIISIFSFPRNAQNTL